MIGLTLAATGIIKRFSETQAKRFSEIGLGHVFKRSCGTDSLAQYRRNRLVIIVLEQIHEHFGLSYTRSTGTGDEVESASSIVAEACKRLGVKLGERTIDKIWQQRHSVDDREDPLFLEILEAVTGIPGETRERVNCGINRMVRDRHEGRPINKQNLDHLLAALKEFSAHAKPIGG
jgi:hypothetical protein